MLVHCRITPSSMSPVPILYTWVERDNVGQSFLSKGTTRWLGLGLEAPTFKSGAEALTTTAPRPHCGSSTVLFPMLPAYKEYRIFSVWMKSALKNLNWPAFNYVTVYFRTPFSVVFWRTSFAADVVNLRKWANAQPSASSLKVCHPFLNTSVF